MDCTRCNGTGRTGYIHIEGGRCFKCDGAGFIGPRKKEKRYPTAREVAMEKELARVEQDISNPFKALMVAAENVEAQFA